MKIVNPTTGRAIAEAVEDDLESVESKRRTLLAGQRRWRAVPFEARIEAVRNFHQLLGSRIEPLARQLTQETGKPLRQSTEEIYAARGRTLYFLEHSQKSLSSELIIADGETTESVRYEPLGVVGVISSWEFPYLAATGVIVPGLIAGNAVLYKPSEYATLSGVEIKRLLYEAGVPSSALQAVLGGGSTGRLVAEAELHGYFFAGSATTGRAVLERVRSRIAPIHLDLSGKNPLYVMEDVEEVSRAARLAVGGAFTNNGQSYSSIERIYVQSSIYDDFLAAFVEGVRSLAVGDPADTATDIGPVAKERQREHLAGLVEDALSKGARLLAGGKAIEREGFFFEPTVIADASHAMDIMREEIYGPVIGIERVSDDEEAAELMQDTDYGVAAFVFSRDEARAKRLLDRLDVGTAYWNSCNRVSPYLPWSGRRSSGLGVTLSPAGIRAFVRPKAYFMKRS